MVYNLALVYRYDEHEYVGDIFRSTFKIVVNIYIYMYLEQPHLRCAYRCSHAYDELPIRGPSEHRYTYLKPFLEKEEKKKASYNYNTNLRGLPVQERKKKHDFVVIYTCTPLLRFPSGSPLLSKK